MNCMDRREFLGCLLGAAGAVGLPLYAFGKNVGDDDRREKRIGYLYDPFYLKHSTGRFHPESPRRLLVIDGRLEQSPLGQKVRRLAARDAGKEDLCLVHTPSYVELVEREIRSGRARLSTGDTVVCKDSFDVAVRAVGGVLAAADEVMSGRVRFAFCAVRPPGHHAGPAKGMGFCIFNNVAVCARYLQKKHGIGKVLIVDWDVHHGNGTQDAFYSDPTVLFFSTHQHPWYPGTGMADETGRGKGKGFTINCPMPAGTGDKEIIAAFEDKLVPAAMRFKPEFVLVSAGFDSRHDDPLGRFRVTDEGFMRLTEIVADIALQHAEGRMVSVLEGGYNLRGMPMAVVAHMKAAARKLG